ncbi:prolipoprotein diacylglyceryl transferase [Parapedobacter tibetensis]|uniref:prolipoprotein diacylglyceryl transferase n=1 Tax=Parapedobacter tibetensis TaxID=2972951 RepID=UPI00214DAB06|nr:prolipoprotein diacylglyceryl transferase [Parapedobacter tibetensis]
MTAFIIHWSVEPELIKLFGVLPIRYYGLFFTVGIGLAYYVISRIYKKENIPDEQFERLAIYVILGTFIGARLGHFLFYQPMYFWEAPLEVFLPIAKVDGGYQFVGYMGLASHGGAIGILLAIILYCQKTKLGFLWVLDRLAVVVPLTGAFIRMGNFMNSEMIGKPTGADYGVVFTLMDDLPRHPGQLYEAGAYLIIFAIMVALYRNRTKQDGFIFGIFLILLFSARFCVEYVKIEQVSFEKGMALNMGQWLSIPFILCGIFLALYKNTPPLTTILNNKN